MPIPLYLIDSKTNSRESVQLQQKESAWTLVPSFNILDWLTDTTSHDSVTTDVLSDFEFSDDEKEPFPEVEECPSQKETMPEHLERYNPRRQGSEARDRLFAHPLSHQERADSASRRRALSQRSHSEMGDVRQPHERQLPQSGLSRTLNVPGVSTNGDRSMNGAEWQRSGQCPSETGSRRSHVLNQAAPRQIRGDFDDTMSTSSVIDPYLQAEFEGKWMLNVTMHFRDNSAREKFIITYAERPNLWRRVSVSCDYRNATPDSLEGDLRTLHYQRDKSMRIYEAIHESLTDVQFFDTVTHLTLMTQDKQLHVNVTEDVNEIIQYPEITSIGHLIQDGLCPIYHENDVNFASHLSGFVYKVQVKGMDCVKKEIPSPDTVEEFLYEINALFALRKAPHIINLVGVVIGTPHSTSADILHDSPPQTPVVKGLLISFASTGALADLLSDATPRIPWGRRRKWARQIVRGLAAIHAAGFVQGDFTLSNIVIDSSDDAMIIDINRRGCPMGWEPPELQGLIRSGQRVGIYIGVKTDLWQLGMVLWALAMHNAEPERETEELIFEDDYDDDESDGEDAGRRVSDVDEMYKTVVAFCLEKEPQKRKEAAELLEMLESERGTRSVYNASFYGSSSVHQFSPNNVTSVTDPSGLEYYNYSHLGMEPASLSAPIPPSGYHPPLHQDSGFSEESTYYDASSVGPWSGSGQASMSYDPVMKELVGVGGGRGHEEDEHYDAELEI